MPQAAAIAAIAGAAATVVGTVQANKAQKKSRRAQQAQQKLQEQRSRRQQIREFQVNRARALSTAQGAGALQGSGTAGGVGGLSSQLGSNLGFQSQFGALSDIITVQQQKSSQGQSLANLGGTALSFGISQGGFGQIQGKLQGAGAPRKAPTSFNNVSGFING